MDGDKEEKLKVGLAKNLNRIIGELEEINERFSFDKFAAKNDIDSTPFFLPGLRIDKEELQNSLEYREMDMEDILYSLRDVYEHISNDILTIIEDYEPSYKYELMDEMELNDELLKLSKKVTAIAKGLRKLVEYEAEADTVESCASSISMLAE